MNDFMMICCSAIATIEGFWTDGSRPMRNNNPGDLRDEFVLPHPTIEAGFWKADTVAEGIALLFHQFALDVARGMTPRQLVASWAPAQDGNATASYLDQFLKLTGIGDPDAPLWNLLTIRRLG